MSTSGLESVERVNEPPRCPRALSQALSESASLDEDIAVTGEAAASLITEVPALRKVLAPKMRGFPLPPALRRTYWGYELRIDKERISRRVQVSHFLSLLSLCQQFLSAVSCSRHIPAFTIFLSVRSVCSVVKCCVGGGCT